TDRAGTEFAHKLAEWGTGLVMSPARRTGCPIGGGTAGPAPGDRHPTFRKAVGSAKDLNHGEVNRSGSEAGDDDNGSIKHVWKGRLAEDQARRPGASRTIQG